MVPSSYNCCQIELKLSPIDSGWNSSPEWYNYLPYLSKFSQNLKNRQKSWMYPLRFFRFLAVFSYFGLESTNVARFGSNLCQSIRIYYGHLEIGLVWSISKIWSWPIFEPKNIFGWKNAKKKVVWFSKFWCHSLCKLISETQWASLKNSRTWNAPCIKFRSVLVIFSILCPFMFTLMIKIPSHSHHFAKKLYLVFCRFSGGIKWVHPGFCTM